MNDKLKTALIAASTALVVVLVIVPFLRGAPGINTIERIIKETVGATPGGTFDFPATFNDRVIRHYGARATSTPPLLTGHTLVATDFTDPGALRVVNIAGAVNTNYTFTLPGSSTLTNLVPNVGDREEVCYLNVASSTSRHNLIFAAGTGVDFVMATTSLNVATTSLASALSFEDGSVGCIDFIRKPADNRATDFTKQGDIEAVLKFNVTADAL